VLMALTECNGMLVPQCCQSERKFLPSSDRDSESFRLQHDAHRAETESFRLNQALVPCNRFPAHTARKYHCVPISGKPMPPCEDSATESPQRRMIRAYGYRSVSPARLENAATPTGGSPFCPARLSLLNSS
jgi:hypothetical protein